MHTIDESKQIIIDGNEKVAKKGLEVKASKSVLDTTCKQLRLVPSDSEMNLKDLTDTLCSHAISDLPYVGVEVEDTFTTRTTAGGVDIIDNSNAEITKIQGDTKACPIRYFNSTTSNADIVDVPSTIETYPVPDNTEAKLIDLRGRSKVSENLINLENKEYPIVLTAAYETKLIYLGNITLSAGTYTYSLKINGNNKAFNKVALSTDNGKTTFGLVAVRQILTEEYIQIASSFTLTETTTIINLWFQTTDSDAIYNVKEIMLLKGNYSISNIPSYQPYFTGLKNAIVTSIKSEGANLVDFKGNVNHPTISGRLGFRINLPVGTYTFSTTKGNTAFIYLGIRNLNEELLETILIMKTAQNHSATFTITNADYNLDLWSVAGVLDMGLSNVMLNRGNIALSCTPYVEPSTLTIPAEIQALDGYGWGLSDTDKSLTNYIDFERKKFVKNIGMRTFNGSEAWGFDDSGNKRFLYFIDNSKAQNNTYKIVANNGYIGTTEYTFMYETILSTDTRFVVGNLLNGVVQWQDLGEWKTYLANLYNAGNPLTLYYQLGTTIETDISQYLTDTKLLSHQGGTIQVLNENAIYNVKPTLTMAYQGNTDPSYTAKYYEGLKNSKLTSLTSKDSNGVVMDIINPNLELGKWDVIRKSVESDNVETPYILDSQSDNVDLGTLDWTYETGYKRFTATISNLQRAIQRTLPLICAKYENMCNGETFDPNWDMVIYNFNTTPAIFIHDHNFTDATLFKESLNGVMVHFPTSTHTYTPLDLNLRYSAYNQGTESIENENAQYGAIPTTTIDYIKKGSIE